MKECSHKIQEISRTGSSGENRFYHFCNLCGGSTYSIMGVATNKFENQWPLEKWKTEEQIKRERLNQGIKMVKF